MRVCWAAMIPVPETVSNFVCHFKGSLHLWRVREKGCGRFVLLSLLDVLICAGLISIAAEGSRCFGFGLRRVFPAEMILNLRRQAYEAFLIRASPITLRAYPQAKISFLPVDFRKIHGRPIVETPDSGNHVQLIRVSVLAQDEVSTIDVVVDETIGLRTGIRERSCSVTIAVHEAPINPHLHVMLVTKCAKFFARLGSRHRPPSGIPPNELPSETVHQWNTMVPFRFWSCTPAVTYVHTPAAFRCQEP